MPTSPTATRLSLPRRPRRLRRTEAIRALVRETRLSPDCFVYPLFVCDGEGVRREVGSMPELDELFDPDADRIAFGINLGLLTGGEDDDDDEAADTTGGDTTHVNIRIGSGGVKADVDAGDDDVEDAVRLLSGGGDL